METFHIFIPITRRVAAIDQLHPMSYRGLGTQQIHGQCRNKSSRPPAGVMRGFSIYRSVSIRPIKVKLNGKVGRPSQFCYYSICEARSRLASPHWPGSPWYTYGIWRVTRPKDTNYFPGLNRKSIGPPKNV